MEQTMKLVARHIPMMTPLDFKLRNSHPWGVGVNKISSDTVEHTQTLQNSRLQKSLVICCLFMCQNWPVTDNKILLVWTIQTEIIHSCKLHSFDHNMDLSFSHLPFGYLLSLQWISHRWTLLLLQVFLCTWHDQFLLPAPFLHWKGKYSEPDWEALLFTKHQNSSAEHVSVTTQKTQYCNK